MQGITAAEDRFLTELARLWQLKKPLVRVDLQTADVAYDPPTRSILLGKLFLRHRPGTRIRRQKLLHELAHHAGMEHDRELGYDTDPKKDRWSRSRLEEVENAMAKRRGRKNPYLTGYQSNGDAGLQGYLAHAGRAGNPLCPICSKHFSGAKSLRTHFMNNHIRETWSNPMFPRMAGMVAPAYGPAQSLITGIYSNPPRRKRRRNPGLFDNKLLLIGGAVIAYLAYLGYKQAQQIMH